MKNYKVILIAFLALVSALSETNGQEAIQDAKVEIEEPGTVIIELISGSRVQGVINEWIIDEYIDIKAAWTDHLVLPASSIDKVIQKSTLSVKTSNVYIFNEEGIYYSGKLQFIAGNEGTRARAVNGLGFSVSAGHRFNRWASAGVGIGYDRFIWRSGENFMPVFVEYTSFFNPKNTSLFATVQAGYSFAFEEEEYLLTKAKGGLMFYPALGLRFGRYETKYTLDLGYKFQRAELTYRSQWEAASSEQRLTYKRLSLRFGILL